jgi:hypothetical protein
MQLLGYTLEIYANSEGSIDPERVDHLLSDAKMLGGNSSPLEYVKPIEGGDPRAWGLRIRIISEEGDR